MVPTVEYRAGEYVFEWSESPIQIGVHQGRMPDIKRRHEKEDFRRDAEGDADEIRQRGMERKIDRMKAPSGDPIEMLRGMVDRVILPEARRVKRAMAPVQHQLLENDVDNDLLPEGEFFQRAAANADQFIG